MAQHAQHPRTPGARITSRIGAATGALSLAVATWFGVGALTQDRASTTPASAPAQVTTTDAGSAADAGGATQSPWSYQGDAEPEQAWSAPAANAGAAAPSVSSATPSAARTGAS